MGFLERTQPGGTLPSGKVGDAANPEQDALRLIEEGNVVEDEGRLEDALRCYDAAIRVAPDLVRAHMNRGNVLLASGNIEGALQAYATAIAKDRGYALAHYNMGMTYARAGRHGEARAALESALALKPDFADAEVALGYSLEELGQLDAAAACYRRALDINPNYAEVHSNLGNVLRALGQLDAALASYRHAIRIKPDFAVAHYGLGKTMQDLMRPSEAVASYRRALEIEPDIAVAHCDLGNALVGLGRVDEAVASYRRALEINPNYAEAHCNLASALLELGQIETALASYRSAVAIKPNFAVAWANLGNALRRLGKSEEARGSIRKALELDPNNARAHSSLGNALKDLGLFDDAVASHRRALQLRPDVAETHSNLGDALRDLGQFEDAVASCRQALKIDPNCVTAYNNLGNALAALGRAQEAVSCYRQGLEIKSDFVQLHFNLGKVLRDFGRPAEAVVSYRRAIEIHPDYVDAHNNLGNALLDLGQLAAAAECYRRALMLKPDFSNAHASLLFCLSHQEAIGAQVLFAEHCSFGEKVEAPLRAAWPPQRNVRDPARCLQVGFVSGDLRDHAVAGFLEPLLAHLAASAGLSLHAYYNHATEDSVSARLRTHIKHWHRIASLSEAALAQRIIDDEIDILIDLSGHTAENRLLTFARKPAPVQASWIGYPGTTGLTAMDYYLADRHFLPQAEFDSQFIEKLVYLPANAPFMADRTAPAVNALPALHSGHVTFGSFNRISKLSRSTVRAWAQLLRALPDSRMLLGGMPRDHEYDWLVEWFVQEGIARNRLRTYPRCETPEYLALHHEVDMCLDTFPYAGGTTTSHALWMGVPTLTLAGHTPPGRQGAAMLGQVGLEAFVAKDADDFLRKGLYWAKDLAALAAVRSGLRQRLAQSPACQPEVIAAALERALRSMWQRWCAGLPPASIDVSGRTEPDVQASGAKATHRFGVPSHAASIVLGPVAV